MSDELRRMKAQQEAQAVHLHRLQQQVQRQNVPQEEHYEEVEEVPQYVQANPTEAMMNSIAQAAAQRAATTVQANLQATQQVQDSVKTRMQRLIDAYPAIQQDDSHLTARARDVYSRIALENPTLDEATKYELAVREAASALGARPVNAPVDDFAAQDYLSPSGGNRNFAMGNPKASKNRLTTNIIKNAQALGIDVDPNSAEGKKNLAELNEYSGRYNADQEESQYRYK